MLFQSEFKPQPLSWIDDAIFQSIIKLQTASARLFLQIFEILLTTVSMYPFLGLATDHDRAGYQDEEGYKVCDILRMSEKVDSQTSCGTG